MSETYDEEKRRLDAEALAKAVGPRRKGREYKAVPVSPFFPVGIMCIILATGLSIALCSVTFAMLWEAIFATSQAGISENATQVLTGWGGGILGVLGAFVGYAIGSKNGKTPETPFIDSVTGMPKSPIPPRASQSPPPPRAQHRQPEPYKPTPDLIERTAPKAQPPAPPGQQGPGTSPPK